MALERLTQITEVGIQSGITLRNVNVEGAYVSGVVTATTLNVTGGGANFAGVVTATSFSGNVTGNITPSGLVVSGVSTFQSSSFWGDGDIAYFGDGQDLLIFHNSTDSIIRDNGTGDLYIEGGNRIRLTNPTALETYAVFNQDGASELYYDNVKRLETSGIGVSITSALTVGTGASVSSPATNVLTLGTNNVERVRIDSSGNTGIGTNNLGAPYKVDVRVNTNDPSTGSPSTGSIFQIRGDDATVGNGPSLSLSNFSGSKETAWRISAVSTSGNNGDLVFNGYAGGATYPEVARFTSAGNLKFPSGQGIDFSATTNSLGTTSSELLSDYEEGTWTPIASASAGTITSYTSSGRYIKIGRIVTLHFAINISNQGTASGAYLLWSGAPYVAANTFTAVGTCREQNVNGFLSTAQINGNGSSGSILRYDNNGVIVNGNFSCTIVYEAA